MLSTSDAGRSDIHLVDKDDEFVMMKIQKRRLRQQAQLREVVNGHTRLIDNHESEVEVMDDEEYKRTLYFLNFYENMIDDIKMPSNMSWDEEVEREKTRMQSQKDKIRRQKETRQLFQKLNQPLE